MATSSQCNLQGGYKWEDRISQQEDEILADILSLLSFKEAGRSSVLSRRWRYLWRLTTHLDFDASESLMKLKCSGSMEVRDIERSKYVTWVDEIMRLHECSTLDVFRIQFYLDASTGDTIDEWIKFMIRKRAKRVEIDLTSYGGNKSYTLSQECYNYFKSVSNLSNIMRLTSLSLCGVNVNGGLLEYLLSKCPHLEMLSISWSYHLVNLKVVGPSLPLKYLKIFRCLSLKSIELSAPKLETFIYYGHELNFILGSNPLLSELNIGGGSREQTLTNCFGLFANYFSHLESLTLKMIFECDSEIPQISELRSLKHLKLVIDIYRDRTLIGFTRFIVAAPSLAKLSLELTACRFMHTQCSPEKLSFQPHHCLKEVEVLGYTGCCFSLARYLMGSAINLEKMVIDPFCEDGGMYTELRTETGEGRVKIQKDVEALKESLPPGAKLIVNHLS